MTPVQQARVRDIVMYLGEYGGHRPSCCSQLDDCNPASDYCDCGLSNARKLYNEAMELLDQ